jgi:hypothetical protein
MMRHWGQKRGNSFITGEERFSTDPCGSGAECDRRHYHATQSARWYRRDYAGDWNDLHRGRQISIASVAMQFPNWGWSFVTGPIRLALAIMLVADDV